MAETKKLNEREEKFLELIFEEKYIGKPKQAAIDAGYPKSVNGSAIMRKLAKEILEGSENYAAMHGPSALLSLIDVLTDPNQRGAKIKADTAKDILDRIGLVKKQQVEVKLDTPSSIIYIPTKNEG